MGNQAMCNDYGNRIPCRDYAEAFSQLKIPLVFQKPDAAPNLEPRDEIWPAEPAQALAAATERAAGYWARGRPRWPA